MNIYLRAAITAIVVGFAGGFLQYCFGDNSIHHLASWAGGMYIGYHFRKSEE